RHDSPPQVVVEPREAEVVRSLYRLLIEEHLSCRRITKHLNEAHIPTPSGQNHVWQPATVRHILTNRVYAGHARYNYRQLALPRYRKKDEVCQTQPIKMTWYPLRLFRQTRSNLRGRFKRENEMDVHCGSRHDDLADQALGDGLPFFKREL